MSAPAKTHRVVYGWSAFEEFPSFEAADERARELAATPTHDWHLTEVRVLAVAEAPARTVATYHREVTA